MSTERRLRKIKRVVRHRQQGAVVLEDISDPRNARAVFRSCDAFGIQDIYLIFEEEPEFDPYQLKHDSSSSAHKWLDFHIFHSTSACLDQLKAKNYQIVATSLEEDACSIYNADLSNPKIALLFGNEHRGLTDKALTMADLKVIIPMEGMVQSLNLSVSAAVCLFEISRQRKEQDADHYRLSSSRAEALIKDFENR